MIRNRGQLRDHLLIPLLIIAAVVVMAIGAWQLGWFVTEKNVERKTEIDNTRTSTQEAWRNEAKRTISDIALLPEGAEAQKAVLTNQACDLIDKLSGTFADDPSLIEFAEENCS